jgi:hypothetical protein
MRRGRGRVRDVSSVRWVLRNHFLPSSRPKMRFGRGRESEKTNNTGTIFDFGL